MSIISELDELRREVERLKTKETARWVLLTAPLTSTSWDGDSFSTTGKTIIDLSAVFSVPANVKAVLVDTYIRDSASAGGDYRLILSPNADATGTSFTCGGVANDRWVGAGSALIPCNADGDIYYQIAASGSGTFDVYIQIWGYLL